MKNDLSFVPIMVGAAGIAVFIGMDATMKAVVAMLPIGQAVCLRYAAGSPFALAVYLRRPTPIPLRSFVANGLRGLLIAGVSMSFFYAVSVLPLADCIAIGFLAPFFIALLGRLLLAEPLHPRVLVGLVIGFSGVIVILHGQLGGGGDRSGALLGFAASIGATFFYALSNVLVRRQSRHDSVEVMVLLQTVFAGAFLIPVAWLVWTPPPAASLWLLALCGLLGTGGQLGLAWALSRTNVARLSVLEYTSFLWATLFGWAFFGEVPTLSTLAGAAVIIGACVVVLKPPRIRSSS